MNTPTLTHKYRHPHVHTWPHLSSTWVCVQSIGVEIAAHEATVEDMKRRNVANMPPAAAADGKAARSGTMLEQLQVHTLTSSPLWWSPPATEGWVQPVQWIVWIHSLI